MGCGRPRGCRYHVVCLWLYFRFGGAFAWPMYSQNSHRHTTLPIYLDWPGCHVLCSQMCVYDKPQMLLICVHSPSALAYNVLHMCVRVIICLLRVDCMCCVYVGFSGAFFVLGSDRNHTRNMYVCSQCLRMCVCCVYLPICWVLSRVPFVAPRSW